jgi:hypothetical protein
MTLHWILLTLPRLGSGSAGAAFAWLGSSRLWLGLEISLIWLPLALHTAFSLARAFAEPPVQGRRLGAALRHAGGLVTLIFLAHYLTQFRLPLALGKIESGDLSQELYAWLSSTTEGGLPIAAALYLLGMGGLSFRFGSELHAARAGSGPETLERRAWVPSVIGAALFAVNAETVVYYATGSRFLFFG